MREKEPTEGKVVHRAWHWGHRRRLMAKLTDCFRNRVPNGTYLTSDNKLWESVPILSYTDRLSCKSWLLGVLGRLKKLSYMNRDLVDFRNVMHP